MRSFVVKIILYSLPVLLPFLWYVVGVYPNITGDLGILGHIRFPYGYSKIDTTLHAAVTNVTYDYTSYNDSSVLIIGDSFSFNTATVTSYTTFLAQMTDRQILNLSRNWDTNTFYRFLYLSQTVQLPPVVIIEVVERAFLRRLTGFDIRLSAQQILQRKQVTLTPPAASTPSRDKSMLSKAQEWSKRKLKLDGYDNPVYHLPLSRDLFSCRGKRDDLYFYRDDIKYINSDSLVLQQAIDNLDALFDYASRLGIDLYVLVAADKYDVYQDFITDNPYPPQDLCERLAEQYPHPHLILSKDTLYRMASEGVQDIFWGNNTHWSPIGAEAVAAQVMRRVSW